MAIYGFSTIYYRNTSKFEAMDQTNFLIFFLKVVCDASSRLTIFGAWMYTVNLGEFSTKMTVEFYYGMVLILFMKNCLFSYWNKLETFYSLSNWIGM